MSLIMPKLDERNYDQLVSEALARIPVHTPEWTNFQDSDTGVAILQLWAFMTDTLLYRSNLIPERNRINFLNLLGVSPNPASSARGFVTFALSNNLIKTHTVLKGLEVKAGNIPFLTENGLDILPLEANVYYKKPIPKESLKPETKEMYDQLYASFNKDNQQLFYYETKLLEPPVSGLALPKVNLARSNQGSNNKDTLDGSLWIALLAKKKETVTATRQAISNKTIILGIMPALQESIKILQPGGPASAEGQPNLIFQIPIGETLPNDPEKRIARYKTIEARFKGNPLTSPAIVELNLPKESDLKLWDNLEPLESGSGDFPPSLEDDNLQNRVITWLRMRLGEKKPNLRTSAQLNTAISWIGVNTAMVTQCARIIGENPGQGTGEPDQQITLANQNIITNSVKLTVDGEPWNQINDLMQAEPEIEGASKKSKVFTTNRKTGEIRFGDGLRGARPPDGAVFRVSYSYGGGKQGNVGIGSIKSGASLPSGIKPTNLLPTWGGCDPESVKQAEKLIPGYLRHRERLISEQDYKEIIRRTPGVELGRVEVLPLFHPDLPDNQSEGVVTIMVIPKYDSLYPEAPKPDSLFLETISAYLCPLRIITTELYIKGPEYLPIWVSMGIDIVAGQDFAPIREEVTKALRYFLSPITGGFEKSGWNLGKAVEPLELMAVGTRVPGVSKVNGINIATEQITISHTQAHKIELTGLQLPRLIVFSVSLGEPQDPEELRGDMDKMTGPEVQIVSVPMIPPQCK